MKKTASGGRQRLVGLVIAMIGLIGYGEVAGSSGVAGRTRADRLLQLEYRTDVRLDRSPTLAGIDADANGIRDDIESFLKALPLEPSEMAAAEQLARAMQRAVVADSGDLTVTRPIDKAVSAGISCVWARLPSSLTAHGITKKLEAYTANTEARTRSYMKYNASLDGTVGSAGGKELCEH